MQEKRDQNRQKPEEIQNDEGKQWRNAYIFGIVMLGILFLTLAILGIMLIRVSFYGGLSVSMLLVGLGFLAGAAYVVKKTLPLIRNLMELK